MLNVRCSHFLSRHPVAAPRQLTNQHLHALTRFPVAPALPIVNQRKIKIVSGRSAGACDKSAVRITHFWNSERLRRCRSKRDCPQRFETELAHALGRDHPFAAMHHAGRVVLAAVASVTTARVTLRLCRGDRCDLHRRCGCRCSSHKKVCRIRHFRQRADCSQGAGNHRLRDRKRFPRQETFAAK